MKKTAAKFLAFLIISVGFALWINFLSSTPLSNTIEQFLRKHIPYYDVNNNGTIAIILLTVLFAGIVFWLTLKVEQKKSTHKNPAKELLEYLRKDVHDSNSLHQQNYIKQSFIQLKQTEAENYIYYKPVPGSENVPADVEILYQRYAKRNELVLITGEAGSGKTTLLRKLWTKLLEDALRNDMFEIPVIINISSWSVNPYSSSFKKENKAAIFIKWAARQLGDSLRQANIRPSLIKEYLERGKFLLLLDGLDETDYPETFLPCLDAYRQGMGSHANNYTSSVIVTCSSDKFNSIFVRYKKEVHVTDSVIRLNAIDDPLYAISGIKDGRHPVHFLRSSLHLHPPLSALLNSAFRIRMAMALANKRIDFSTIRTDTDLIDTYIKNEIDSISPDYRSKRAYRYLSTISRIEEGIHPKNGFNTLDCSIPESPQELVATIMRPLVTLILGYLIGRGIYACFLPFFDAIGPRTFKGNWLTLWQPIVFNKQTFLQLVALGAIGMTYLKEPYFLQLRSVLFPRKDFLSYLVLFAIGGYASFLLVPFILHETQSIFYVLCLIATGVLSLLNDDNKAAQSSKHKSGQQLWVAYVKTIFHCCLKGIQSAFLISFVLFILEFKVRQSNAMPFLQYGIMYTYIARPGYFPFSFLITISALLAAFYFLKTYVYSFLFDRAVWICWGKMPLSIYHFLDSLHKRTDLILYENGHWKFTHLLIKRRLRETALGKSRRATEFF